MRLFAVLAVLLVSYVCAQNVGGTAGPCSAVAIPPPYTKPITVFGSNAGAQTYSSSCYSTSSGVVWYTITPPAGANITLTTCNPGTNFDTVISVYNASSTCSSYLYCNTYNDDASCTYTSSNGTSSPSGRSTVSFISAGYTYYVTVSGYSSNSGTFQLTLSQANTSSGNNGNAAGCSSATPIYGPYTNEITVFGNNQNGTTGSYSFNGTICQIANYQYSSWYQIFPVVGKQLNITTCNPATNFDTVLTVVAGSSCSALNCTARSDDSCIGYLGTASSVSFVPTATSYFVIVTGYSSYTGTYELSIQQSSGTTNNGTSATTCSTAGSVSATNGTTVVYGSTVGSPATLNDACARYNNRSAVWYRVQTPTFGAVTVSTCSSSTNFDTVLLVYGGSCSSLTCVAYNDDYSCSQGSSTTSTLTFYPTTSYYYVVVAAYSGSGGSFALSISSF